MYGRLQRWFNQSVHMPCTGYLYSGPCFLQMASTRRPATAQGLSVRLDSWHDASCVLIPPGGDVSADASDKSTACLMFFFPKMCVSYLICDGAIGDDMWRRKWGVQRQELKELFPLPRLSRCQFTYAVHPFQVHVRSWLHKALFYCVAPWRPFSLRRPEQMWAWAIAIIIMD